MNATQGDVLFRYVLAASDQFKDDLDRKLFNLNARLGPHYADAWCSWLAQALEGLTGFPGPLSCAREEECSDRYGREVRHILFHGPTRFRVGIPFHVIFLFLPPAPAATHDVAETTILLLRLFGGGMPMPIAEASPNA